MLFSPCLELINALKDMVAHVTSTQHTGNRDRLAQAFHTEELFIL